MGVAAQYPVVVLTGPRQTGKTTLLQQGIQGFNFVTLDLPSVAEQANTSPEVFLAQHPEPLIIDEVHTPDSSRYWEGSTYEARKARGEEPESLDKEIVRRAYADLGYRGDGPAPTLSADIWASVAAGYRTAFERLTGQPLRPVEIPAGPRIIRSLTTSHYLVEGS